MVNASRLNEAQKQKLTEMMEQSYIAARRSGIQGRIINRNGWERIMREVNSLGRPKTLAQLTRCWSDMKMATKRKFSKLKQAAQRGEGKPADFTEEERRISLMVQNRQNCGTTDLSKHQIKCEINSALDINNSVYPMHLVQQQSATLITQQSKSHKRSTTSQKASTTQQLLSLQPPPRISQVRPSQVSTSQPSSTTRRVAPINYTTEKGMNELLSGINRSNVILQEMRDDNRRFHIQSLRSQAESTKVLKNLFYVLNQNFKNNSNDK